MGQRSYNKRRQRLNKAEIREKPPSAPLSSLVKTFFLSSHLISTTKKLLKYCNTEELYMLKLLALCLLTSLMYVQIAEAGIRYYKWEVKYEYKSPDCYKKLAITINGGTPGPTILAQKGDTVIVEVKNSLMLENLAIHWHGIRQVNTAQVPFSFSNQIRYLCIHVLYFTSTHILLFDLLQIGSPWSDGTEGVTQCPIFPGDTFKYEFKVDRVGVVVA
jgi:hypothetical protein